MGWCCCMGALHGLLLLLLLHGHGRVHLGERRGGQQLPPCGREARERGSSFGVRGALRPDKPKHLQVVGG